MDSESLHVTDATGKVSLLYCCLVPRFPCEAFVKGIWGQMPFVYASSNVKFLGLSQQLRLRNTRNTYAQEMPHAAPYGVRVTDSSEQVSRTEVFIRDGACSQLSQTLVTMMLTPICSRLPLRTCTLSCSRVHGNAESLLYFNRQHRGGWQDT